ncbi:MAG: hypothetical protein U5O69_06410 [Candidatus Competibacteraceae bacterium]|nr:hypothetical protein [Candidatus Competibacteraceae bacterium]
MFVDHDPAQWHQNRSFANLRKFQRQTLLEPTRQPFASRMLAIPEFLGALEHQLLVSEQFANTVHVKGVAVETWTVKPQ